VRWKQSKLSAYSRTRRVSERPLKHSMNNLKVKNGRFVVGLRRPFDMGLNQRLRGVRIGRISNGSSAEQQPTYSRE